jgi:hypothetical protein
MIQVGDLVTVHEIDTVGLVVGRFIGKVWNVSFCGTTYTVHENRLRKLGEQQ